MKITISGLPGAGKGELRKNLSREYNIKSFSVGDLRREYAAKLGMTIQEFNALGEKDPSTDRKADEYQVEWAKQNESFVLEGRLSYHFIPQSIKLFLTVDEKVGAERILKENRDSEKRVKTLEEQVEINGIRCKSDIKRYSDIYGISNCYDENNFDIVINTSNKTINEVTRETKNTIEKYLTKK